MINEDRMESQGVKYWPSVLLVCERTHKRLYGFYNKAGALEGGFFLRIGGPTSRSGILATFLTCHKGTLDRGHL